MPKIEPKKYAILRYMRSDKGEAFVLRRQGKSYREISKALQVPVSTLSNWFKGVNFSEAIREELTKEANSKKRKYFQDLNRVRGVALEVQYELAEKEALKEMKLYRNVPLFTTGLALYWGEGDKLSKHHVRIINTDPAVLQIFMAFLHQFCLNSDEKISLAMYIYEDLDEAKCKRYWSKQVGIKKFHKTQVLPGRHKTKRLPYGTCAIVLTNSYLKRKLQVWIDHLPEMVLNTVPKKKRGLG